MVGIWRIEPVRAVWLGLAALALAGCATAPAPVASGWPATRSIAPPPPYDPSSPPRVTDYSAHLQCVPFARNASGIDIYGNANTWWVQAEGRYPRSNVPAAGAVLVTRGYRDPSRGHVAFVTHVSSDRVIIVDHANWLNGGEISVGVPVLDVSAANDWSQVRVWNIPSGQWGARTYEVEGFIHPFSLRGLIS